MEYKNDLKGSDLWLVSDFLVLATFFYIKTSSPKEFH